LCYISNKIYPSPTTTQGGAGQKKEGKTMDKHDFQQFEERSRRRERKKLAEKSRIPKSGRSVFTIERVKNERAEKLRQERKKREDEGKK